MMYKNQKKEEKRERAKKDEMNAQANAMLQAQMFQTQMNYNLQMHKMQMEYSMMMSQMQTARNPGTATTGANDNVQPGAQPPSFQPPSFGSFGSQSFALHNVPSFPSPFGQLAPYGGGGMPVPFGSGMPPPPQTAFGGGFGLPPGVGQPGFGIPLPPSGLGMPPGVGQPGFGISLPPYASGLGMPPGVGQPGFGISLPPSSFGGPDHAHPAANKVQHPVETAVSVQQPPAQATLLASDSAPLAVNPSTSGTFQIS
jgi:hypothetical protein